MIKQGLVTETVSDMSGTGLTYVNNLPQWSRINTLDKARYPKPFMRDRLQPLTNSDELNRENSKDSEDFLIESNTELMNPDQRIAHLEKSMQFLSMQHQDILTNLHEEIDKLKRENKELKFHIVMLSRSSKTPTSGNSVRDKATHSAKQNSVNQENQLSLNENDQNYQDEKLDEIKIIFLEEEIRELKSTIKLEQKKNEYLAQLVKQNEKAKVKSRNNSSKITDVNSDAIDISKTGSLKKAPPLVSSGINGPTPPMLENENLPFSVKFKPLQVQYNDQPARSPNQLEIDLIIRNLQLLNDKQSHELIRLKADLRDVLYSHKWTPDAYLLAKAYIAEDDLNESSSQQPLPRLKQPNRKLPDVAYIHHDSVVLPALRQTVSNKAIERKKKAQILQKARMHREISAKRFTHLRPSELEGQP